MFNIEKYIQKFLENLESTDLHKKQILEIIEKQTQLKLSPDQIEVKNHIVYIQASPVVKNRLFIHKERVLNEILELTSLKILNIL